MSEARHFAGSHRVGRIAALQPIAAIEFLLKEFAGARNQRYLQLWSGAA
jgi:hypothetical protein